jgi:hypothetical protein
VKRERPTDEELFRAVRNLNLELMATEGFELARAVMECDPQYTPAGLLRWAEQYLESYAGIYNDIMEKDDAA